MDPADSTSFTAPQAHLLTAIHKAAAFEAEGHDATQEAARWSEVVYWLLHPDMEQRWSRSQLSKKGLPWLWASLDKELPKCPVEL